MKRIFHLLLVGVVIALGIAFGWVVGLLALLVMLPVWALRFERTAAALEPTRTCSRCQEPVSIYGLWRCGSCGAVTEGSAWRCPLCRADYAFVPCPRCRVAVLNPDRGDS